MAIANPCTIPHAPGDAMTDFHVVTDLPGPTGPVVRRQCWTPRGRDCAYFV
jgi:hypothetical protein